MNRSFRSIAAGLAAAVCLWPGASGAQEAQPTRAVTVEQARDAFTGAGFQVDEALSWDWTSPPVTSFQVHDPRGRILMVLVYPNATAADAERIQAQTHEEALQASPGISGVGPHLVIGYGTSVWRGNLALVQTTQSELNRAYQRQQDRDNGQYVDSTPASEPGAPLFAVDLDFQQALDNGAVNL